nr:GDT1-like protein 1, chloroplastic [Ipomoea trifida]
MLGVALSSESPLLRPIRATHVPLQNFSPNFLRFFNFRFHTKSSRPNNSLVISGCSRQLCGCKYDGLRGNFILKEVKTSKRKCCCRARLPHAGDECNLTRKSTLLNRPRKNEMGSAFEVLNISHDKFLKFVSMSGLLALLGAQEAIAASDIATGLQATSIFGDLGDISTGFASAFLLIFFSELGDKTFFIAALLAARNSSIVTFFGTFGALGVMTIISVVLGRTFHYVDDILPFRIGGTDLPIDDIAAVILLLYFGVSTLLDASSSDGGKAEEEQKEAELAVSELSGNGAGILAAANTVISTFVLVFVAEWGDKSFFSTIALAAASSPLGVIAGALAGHGVATLLAVLGGSLLGSFLSEKVIAYIGGTLFLVFAAVTLVEIVT